MKKTRAKKLKQTLRQSSLIDQTEFLEAFALIAKYENENLIIADLEFPMGTIDQCKITSYEFHFWAGIEARLKIQSWEKREKFIDLQEKKSIRKYNIMGFEANLCFN